MGARTPVEVSLKTMHSTSYWPVARALSIISGRDRLAPRHFQLVGGDAVEAG